MWNVELSSLVAQDQGAMVKVSCYPPVVTTLAPIYYTKSQAWGNESKGSVI